MFNLQSLLIVALLSSAYSVEIGPTIDSIECKFCQKLFGYVYNLLDEDRAIKSIENALDTVCGQIFPNDQIATCKDYVEKYTPKIVVLIVKNTDPEEACSLLCSASGQSKSLLKLFTEKIFEATVHNDRCNKCLVDVDALRTDLKLARNFHVPKLLQCCGQFPTPDGICDSYIETVGSIYDALESKLVPEEACGTFGVCAPSQANPVTVKQSTVGKVEPDCILCVQVFRLVNQVINKQAKLDIELALDKVCDSIMLWGMQKACRNMVDKYTTQLVDFIAKHSDPNDACKVIGMCNQRSDYTNGLISLISESYFSKTLDDCDNCNKSVSWAAVTINGYATSFNGMLENICLDYARDIDLCKGYMADRFDSFTDELIGKTSSDYLCTNIFGLCPTTKQTRSYIH